MACIICGEPTRVVFRKERNVSCGDYFEGTRLDPVNAGEVEFIECQSCGFAAFAELQSWPPERYSDEIYNADYHLFDAPFLQARPHKIAAWLSSIVTPCTLIDYGGGDGHTARLLIERGFEAHSFDPFYGDARVPSGTASTVTAFEVVEHVPDQRTLFQDLEALCRPAGIVILSTLLKPLTLTAADWWYASARNGHVSFHSRRSLALAMSGAGMSVVSLSAELHVAARDPAALAQTATWPAITINDQPRFKFAIDWSTMVPAP